MSTLVSVQIFHPLFNGCFLIVEFASPLSVLNTGPLSDVYCKDPFPACAFSFHPVHNVFHRVEVVNFNEVKHQFFSFIDYTFGVIS